MEIFFSSFDSFIENFLENYFAEVKIKKLKTITNGLFLQNRKKL